MFSEEVKRLSVENLVGYFGSFIISVIVVNVVIFLSDLQWFRKIIF